jgi:uncharacterized protein with ParB-like and HNH nuclease domain
MKTGATSKRVKELIVSLRDEKLLPQPDYQRRLVWSTTDKNNFIDTVLKGYPFPEIFLADAETNLETADSLKVIVDGQQRITTLYDYFTNSPLLKLSGIQSYNELDKEARQNFLDYEVAVRDLGNATKDEIIEVFKRINATSYPLNAMELNNAIYEGALKKFAERITNIDFFEKNRIFSAVDYKRMNDIRYVLTIICTMIVGYFNRDDELASLLEKFNDEFPYEEDIENRINSALSYIEKFSFSENSRIWKKADFFTILIEIDNLSETEKLDSISIRNKLNDFYAKVDLASTVEQTSAARDYYLASVQGTNSKSNRLNRGKIIRDVIIGASI